MLPTYPTLLLLYITYLEVTRRCGIGGKPYFLTAILTAGSCFINILHHDSCLMGRPPIAKWLIRQPAATGLSDSLIPIHLLPVYLADSIRPAAHARRAPGIASVLAAGLSQVLVLLIDTTLAFFRTFSSIISGVSCSLPSKYIYSFIYLTI